MWPDRVLIPGPITYESGALLTALRGLALPINFKNLNQNSDAAVNAKMTTIIALPDLLFRPAKNSKKKSFVMSFTQLRRKGKNENGRLACPENVSIKDPVKWHSGPSCSKLTMSLVNISLNFLKLISQICQYFLLKKCEKLLQCKSVSQFFDQKYMCIWL